VSSPHHAGWESKLMAGCVVVLALGLAIADAIRQSHVKGVQNPNDFVTLYAGSICMADACNPYRVQDLDEVLVKARGSSMRQDWSDQLPIYPPTTLVLLLPLSLLSYKSATILWYSLSLATYVFGLCWLYFFSSALGETRFIIRVGAVLLGLHFPKMLQCLGFGNPSLIVTGLLLFCVFDKAESRKILRLICIAIACLLKPPLALPLVTLVLFKEPKRPREGCIATTLLALIFLALGLFAFLPPGMAHWPLDLSQNLALGERGGMNPSLRGAPSNTLLNIATLPGYFVTNPVSILLISFTVVATLTMLYLIALNRLRKSALWETRGYLLAVAALAVLTLLPVYHRFCDIGVLLLVVPWVIRGFSQRPRWQAFLSALLLALLYFSWERRIHLDRMAGIRLNIVRFLYYRGDALLVVLLACVLLSAMYVSRGHKLRET
jgi:Glycosyltransferase family 87